MNEVTIDPNLRGMTPAERAWAISEFLDMGEEGLALVSQVLGVAAGLHPNAEMSTAIRDAQATADRFFALLDAHLVSQEAFGEQAQQYMRSLALMTDTELAIILAARPWKD